MVLSHGHQKYLELSEFLVFKEVDALRQKRLDRSVKCQHEWRAFGVFPGRFDLY